MIRNVQHVFDVCLSTLNLCKRLIRARKGIRNWGLYPMREKVNINYLSPDPWRGTTIYCSVLFFSWKLGIYADQQYQLMALPLFSWMDVVVGNEGLLHWHRLLLWYIFGLFCLMRMPYKTGCKPGAFDTDNLGYSYRWAATAAGLSESFPLSSSSSAIPKERSVRGKRYTPICSSAVCKTFQICTTYGTDHVKGSR